MMLPTLRMIVGFIAWFSLVTIGTRVDASQIDPAAWYYGPAIVLTSTLTNLGLVAIAASIAVSDSRLSTNRPIHAAQRGFILYALALGPSALIFTDAVVTMPSSDQYAKLMFALTTTCALAARFPDRFEQLLAAVMDKQKVSTQ